LKTSAISSLAKGFASAGWSAFATFRAATDFAVFTGFARALRFTVFAAVVVVMVCILQW
jgi:hypothetical protein